MGAVAVGHVFHASDRLITVPKFSKRGGSRAWDIASNKTVIVIGSDCWLVLGYTGLAYLDGKPTDQLIAEAITGVPDLSSGGMVGWHLPPAQRHYRAITDRVEASMAAAYTRLQSAEQDFPTTVLGVGIQRARPRFRQVMFESVISKHGVTHKEMIHRHQPRFGSHVNTVGSDNSAIHASCREALRNFGAESPEVFRDILMDTVQATGSLSDVVGEDVMSVMLEPMARRVSVEFRQAPSGSSVPLPSGKGVPTD